MHDVRRDRHDELVRVLEPVLGQRDAVLGAGPAAGGAEQDRGEGLVQVQGRVVKLLDRISLKRLLDSSD